MSAGPWAVLGIEPTADKGAIRRAYAARLKAMDVDRDVEGFAALRAARDAALVLAKGMEEAPVASELALADEGPRFEGGPIGASWDEQEDQPAPATVGSTEPETETQDQPQQPTPPAILYDLLFPNGEYCADGLESHDLQIALDCLHAIADDAQSSPVDRERAIEEWLALQLATAWPRSTFLVEPAAARFHWAETEGQLTEIPAVRFLNARLAGMRFVSVVGLKAHPLHKAWVELSREGPMNVLSRLRTRRKDVAALLADIRTHYPEAESYLDPVRVSSWEASPSSGGLSVGRWIWIGFVVLSGLVRILGDTGGPPGTQASPPSATTSFEHEVDAAHKTQALATDLFGVDSALPRLPTMAPELDTAFSTYRSMFGDQLADLPGKERQIHNLLRYYALRAAAVADFSDLVAIKHVQLELVRQASLQGGSDLCLRAVKGDFIDVDFAVDDNIRMEERALYLHLLDKGLLRIGTVEFPKSAPIPARIVQDVMENHGFTQMGFERAAKGKGPPSQQCAYQIALMEAVLKQPSSVPISLLRMI